MSDNSFKKNSFGEIIKDGNAIKSVSTKRLNKSLKDRVSILPSEDVDQFTPMQWPIMDNGKKPSTNALGFPINTWFQEEQLKAIEEDKRLQQVSSELALEDEELLKAQKEENKAPTVEEIALMKETAYEEGLEEGKKDGYKEGLSQGIEAGKLEGIEQGKAQGYQEGFEKGLYEGHQDGFIKGQEDGINNASEMMNEQIARLSNIIDMLSNPMRSINKDVTDQLVYLVSRLASVIIKREVVNDANLLQNSITEALSVLPNSQKGATVYLNEDDYALVQTRIGQDFINEHKLNIQVKDDLNLGDVEVSNDISSVDWRVNDRIDNLLSKFLMNASGPVDSALTEHIDSLPEYNEVPLKSLAPRPNLFDVEDKIAHNLGLDEEQANLETESAVAQEENEYVENNEEEENLFSGITNNPFDEDVADAPSENAEEIPQN